MRSSTLKIMNRHRLRHLLRSTPVRHIATRYRHRDIDQSDVFLASYPRSGNTWLKHLLADLVADADLPFEQIDRIVATVGSHRAAPRLLPAGGRLIKTHEPYRASYRRAIYIVRDVRDVALSYHRWSQGLTAAYSIYGEVYEELDKFLPPWLEGRLDGYGSWENHVRSWRLASLNQAADLLWVRYEDLRVEPLPTFRRIADWLGVQASDERLNLALERNSLSRMRAKEKLSADYTARQYS
ncbi:MAG: sulfotransferase domain-containing protein, partial [Actinobacteria bacterium]|nr:sulfotransferase domain-containing protein [Actinomycetota bacterium]